MLTGQMLRGQMSPWRLGCVKDGPRNLRLKFCQNWFSNSRDIVDIEFVVVVVGGGGGGCAKSFSCKTYTYVMLGYVELRLCWGFDNRFSILQHWNSYIKSEWNSQTIVSELDSHTSTGECNSQVSASEWNSHECLSKLVTIYNPASWW